ncbi:MAG TPA: hypothetical protein VEG27_01640 [Usitatibacter sp.]|nr:hypothetical protein [Usitatibacter sp.]
MIKKALMLAAVIAPTAAGVGAQSPYPPKQQSAPGHQEPITAARCTESPCHLDVSVDESKEPCRVRIEPEALLLYGVRDAKIEWKLTTPGAKLVSIDFKENEKSFKGLDTYRKHLKVRSSSQFRDKHVRDTDADVVDANSAIGSWLYAVVVKKGEKTCSVDPPIINEY